MRASAAGGTQRGVALLLVLWACTLLAVLLGGLATLARTEGLQARYQFAQTRAHYAAEAGLMRAVYALQDPQPRQRWFADGRPYRFQFDGAQLVVSAVSEAGKVDLNAAMPSVLQALFVAAGSRPDAAQKLAAQVVDWRAPPAVASAGAQGDAAYAAAGRSYRPRHAPFASIEEVQMVLGMTPALYRRIANDITIWGGTAAPDPNTATPLALESIPGVDAAQLRALREARLKNAGDPGLVAGPGTTHSIQSEATLADGTRAMLRATIRLRAGAGGAQSQPYVVLRWQEGTEE
jgi:general secretion pathway protein K